MANFVSVTKQKDGSLLVRARADEDGVLADAVFVVNPDDERYGELLKQAQDEALDWTDIQALSGEPD